MKITIYDRNLEMIANSGQAFRFNRAQDGWGIYASDKYCVGEQSEGNIILRIEDEDEYFWRSYFRSTLNLRSLNRYLYQSVSAPFAKDAIDYCDGLVLLKQDPFECLISFILSQRKSIPAIKSCIGELCSKYGRRLAGAGYSFPTLDELYEGIIEKDNSHFSLPSAGYRQKYIDSTVKDIYHHKSWWNSICQSRDRHLVELKLQEYSGVGPKVASCVALYGLDHTSSFPIDVWMARVIEEDFGGKFDLKGANEYAGVLQLYMFYYKRVLAGTIK